MTLAWDRLCVFFYGGRHARGGHRHRPDRLCGENDYGRDIIKKIGLVHCGKTLESYVTIAEDRFETCDARIRSEIDCILRDLGFVYAGRTLDDQACFVDLVRLAREIAR